MWFKVHLKQRMCICGLKCTWNNVCTYVSWFHWLVHSKVGYVVDARCCVTWWCSSVIVFVQNSMVSAECLAELEQLVAARNPLQQKQKQESVISEEPLNGTAVQQTWCAFIACAVIDVLYMVCDVVWCGVVCLVLCCACYGLPRSQTRRHWSVSEGHPSSCVQVSLALQWPLSAYSAVLCCCVGAVRALWRGNTCSFQKCICVFFLWGFLCSGSFLGNQLQF